MRKEGGRERLDRKVLVWVGLRWWGGGFHIKNITVISDVLPEKCNVFFSVFYKTRPSTSKCLPKYRGPLKNRPDLNNRKNS